MIYIWTILCKLDWFCHRHIVVYFALKYISGHVWLFSFQIVDGWQWWLYCKHYCGHEQRFSRDGVSIFSILWVGLKYSSHKSWHSQSLVVTLLIIKLKKKKIFPHLCKLNKKHLSLKSLLAKIKRTYQIKLLFSEERKTCNCTLLPLWEMEA